MKVGKLKELLEDYDDDTEVVTPRGSFDGWDICDPVKTADFQRTKVGLDPDDGRILTAIVALVLR